MKNQIDIRKYHPKDLVGLMAAWESANSLAHPFLSEENVAQVRQDIPSLYIPNTETWVAELEARVVGFMSLLGNEVSAIFLLPEYHGVGIGAALMNKAQQLRGDLNVEVFEANSIGRQFYRRYGFETMSTKIHELTGEKVLRLKYVSSGKGRENAEEHFSKSQ